MAEDTKKDATEATNTEALDKLVKLIVDAFNDVENAFGQGKSGLSFSSYGNLMMDIMSLSGDIGELPAELMALDAPTIAQLIKNVASELTINNARARDIVAQIVAMVSNLLTTTLAQAEGIAASIKAIKEA